MARKQTYRSRYTNQIIEAGAQTPVKKEREKRPPINPEIQEPYAAGKAILIDKPLHWTSFDVFHHKVRPISNISIGTHHYRSARNGF